MLATIPTEAPVAVAALLGDVVLDDVAALRKLYEEWHGREKRFATIVDARRINVPPSIVRRAMADLGNEFEERSKRNAVCVVVLLDSRVLIGVLSAVRWFLRDPVELRYFATAKEALAFIAPKLAAEKIEMPAAVRERVEMLDGATTAELAKLASAA